MSDPTSPPVEEPTPDRGVEALHSLLTLLQRTMLKGVNDGTLIGVRVYYERIIHGFIGEVRLVLDEVDADTEIIRTYSVTPTGTIWDDHTKKVEDV